MGIANSEVTDSNGNTISTLDQILNMQIFAQEPQNDILIRSNSYSSAEIYTTDDAISLTVEGSNGININNTGTCIDGKMHFAQEPSSIQMGGFWNLNDELMTGLPSTIYTPIPVLEYKGLSFAKYLNQISAFG